MKLKLLDKKLNGLRVREFLEIIKNRIDHGTCYTDITKECTFIPECHGGSNDSRNGCVMMTYWKIAVFYKGEKVFLLHLNDDNCTGGISVTTYREYDPHESIELEWNGNGSFMVVLQKEL